MALGCFLRSFHMFRRIPKGFAEGILPFVMEPVSETEHQVVRILEFRELVAHVQKKVFRDGCLQCQNLIETFRIFSFE